MSERSASSSLIRPPISRGLRIPASCPTSPPTPILDFTRDGVIQGAVEGSNVDPVREMTRLIEVTRAFDGVAAETSQSEIFARRTP